MKELENNIEREITIDEICRTMGVLIKTVEEITNLFLEVAKVLKKVVEESLKLIGKILKSIDMNKYKKFIKYKKRVKNRNKLHAKRRHKYGK